MALDLTLEQWRFEYQFGGAVDGSVTGDGTGAQDASVGGGFGLTKLLGTGARIVGDLGASLFRIVATGDGWDTLTTASLSVTQPLLQGAGRAIVMEPLTQAERDLVYQVRSFERFRRTFAVDVASRVYRLAQSLDSVANQEANVESLKLVRERNQALAEAGIVSDIDVDQARQDELRSQNQLLVLRQNLQNDFDGLKLFLGLPVDADIGLDPGVLAELRKELEDGDPLLEQLDEDTVSSVALANRLDFLTEVDEVYDSERRILIAADALEAGLDFIASVDASSEEGRPLAFRSENVDWTAGFVLDLPIDQLPERNAYRQTLIDHDRQVRGVEELGDRIRANLRELLREVETARESYRLQINAVTLAERRVESARLNLEAGRAETRDLLDAQRDLLTAQNAATLALIEFALARLDLYLEMEVLAVDQSGISVDNSILAPPTIEQ